MCLLPTPQLLLYSRGDAVYRLCLPHFARLHLIQMPLNITLAVEEFFASWALMDEMMSVKVLSTKDESVSKSLLVEQYIGFTLRVPQSSEASEHTFANVEYCICEGCAFGMDRQSCSILPRYRVSKPSLASSNGFRHCLAPHRLHGHSGPLLIVCSLEM